MIRCPSLREFIFLREKVHREGSGRESTCLVPTPWSPPMPILSEKLDYRGRGKLIVFPLLLLILHSSGVIMLIERLSYILFFILIRQSETRAAKLSTPRKILPFSHSTIPRKFLPSPPHFHPDHETCYQVWHPPGFCPFRCRFYGKELPWTKCCGK